MQTLIQAEVTTKILRYLQHRIAQKLSAGENILTLLPYENSNADIATCLYLLEQADALISPKVLYH